MEHEAEERRKLNLSECMADKSVDVEPEEYQMRGRNRLVNTELEGYSQLMGLRTELDYLNQIYEQVGPNGSGLEKVGKGIEKFSGFYRPTTKDGYCWFWSLQFFTDNGKVAVLFPWYSGSLDRSIGIYLQGNVPTEQVDELLVKISDSLIKEYLSERKLRVERAKSKN